MSTGRGATGMGAVACGRHPDGTCSASSLKKHDLLRASGKAAKQS